MKDYLLTLFSERQPRRIRVIENVLKNKKTVANLFWAKTYHLLPWFGAEPHLSRADYEQTLAEFCQKGLLVNQEGLLNLTPSGRQSRDQFVASHYQPHFFDYYWVANPRRVEGRTLIAIQALSELAADNQNYAPLTVAFEDSTAVKHWLLHHSRHLIATVEDDCLSFGESLARVDRRLADLFTSQMTGHGMNGSPAAAEAKRLGVSDEELAMMRRDVWLDFAYWCLMHHSVWKPLMASLINPSPLSNSASQSLRAYQNGQTATAIASRRHLKISTIREHLLAAAILTPQSVNWDQLLPVDLRQRLGQVYQGPVAEWHYQQAGQNDPQAFFDFRLFQIWSELHDAN